MLEPASVGAGRNPALSRRTKPNIPDTADLALPMQTACFREAPMAEKSIREPFTDRSAAGESRQQALPPTRPVVCVRVSAWVRRAGTLRIPRRVQTQGLVPRTGSQE